jgi:hypothetical protein
MDGNLKFVHQENEHCWDVMYAMCGMHIMEFWLFFFHAVQLMPSKYYQKPYGERLSLKSR